MLVVSKEKSLPKSVHKGNDMLANAGMDKRFLTMRPITKFSVHDKLSIHPLAVANYVESKKQLQLRKDADANDYVHEIGHHLDIAYTRAGGKEINSAVAAKVINDYKSEYRAAREKLSTVLGHKFNFTNDNEKISDLHVKGLPTAFAADSSKEWFAESFYLYCKGGAARERLESIAPKTTAAIKTVLKGGIFASQDLQAGGPGSGRRPYGRHEKPVSTKAERALKSHKDVSKHVHMIAALNEAFVAKAVDGVLIRSLAKSDPLKGVGPGSKATHHPFDVLLPHKKIAIEVKTLQTTKGNVVNMKMESRLKKEKWAANNGYKKIWMVVVDTRNKDSVSVYIAPKIKKWSLTTMQKIGSFSNLKRYIK